MKILLFLLLPCFLAAQTLTFTGPQACEYDSLNPFSNYRMDVVFTKGADTLVAPGFFAADGDAANSSAKCGDQWAVNFNPPSAGTWNYNVLFSSGVNAAITGHTNDTMPPHGEQGALTMEQGVKLEYIGERYRRWRTGEYFLKFGTDSPETFLAYEDFDGTYFQGTGGSETLLDYAEHAQDWESGDPVWQDSLGRGMIGALNYLADQEQNAISFVLMNINGDGRNCWPFVAHDTLNRFDVSKLAQWRIVLAHAGALGIHWQAKFGELENHTLLSDNQWKLMYRELVARFGDLPALTWNLGEEFLFQGLGEQLPARVNYLRSIDPYPNLIVFHNLTVLADIFNNTTVRNLIDGGSIQIGQLHWTDSIMTSLYEYNNDSTFVLANDEQGPSDWGVPTDTDNLPQTQEQVRQLNQFPVMFLGAEGWEAYYGYDTGCDDLSCDNFRTRENVWEVNRDLREVMSSIAFWEGHPLPLVDTGYCFGGEELLVYSSVGSVTLDLTGEYEVQYFDFETWTDPEPFTGVLSYGDEFVARVVPAVIVGICIYEFDAYVIDCVVHLSWSSEYPAVLEESNGGGWHEICPEGSTYEDITPSKFYRLTCGGDTRIILNYDWCAPYWIAGHHLFVNKAGYYEIYGVDGKTFLEDYLEPGAHVVLSTGVYVIVFNGVSTIYIIHG